jgi:TonB family protein
MIGHRLLGKTMRMMKRCRRRLLLSALVGALVNAPLALGQTTAATQAPDPWFTQTSATLKLNAQQQAAFRTYEDLVNAQGPDADARTSDQLLAMPLPDYLDYLATHLTREAGKVHARADAARQFFAALSPDQQQQFSDLIRPSHGSTAPIPQPFLAAVTKNLELPSHTNPTWLEMPSGDIIGRVYPSDARRHHTAGKAVLDCAVDKDGYLADCQVESETPKDAGFGNAALEITAYMRMSPATEYGVPVTSKVQVPVSFAY